MVYKWKGNKLIKSFLILTVLFFTIILSACDKTEDGADDGAGPIITGQPNTDYTPGEQVTVDIIDGLYDDTTIYSDSLITFHIRFNNNVGDALVGFTMGFRVFSYQNSVRWNTTAGEHTGAITLDMISIPLFISNFSVTGANADTIGFGGFDFGSGSGILQGFNDHAFTIQIGPIPSSYHGGWICLDTAFYPPGGAWLWTKPNASSITPDWDGPRWFRVVDPAKGN